MKVRCRDLGRMDYASCLQEQQSLFDELLMRKRSARGAKESEAQGADSARGRQRKGPEAQGTDSGADVRSAEEPGTQGMGAQGAGSGSEARNAGSFPAEDDLAGTVLLVEHPPVYTLGKSGHAENLLIGERTLRELGAQFFHTDRGGDITFHGPGQIVCYPILDLERLGMGLREYIAALEEAVIRTVARYDIRAGRIDGASGVWIDPEGRMPRKICAIGVRSSRYVTMHGFALNVSTDLGWFSRINPCGFTDRGVTSIERETGRTVPMQEVKRTVVEELAATLRCRIVAAP